MKGSPYEEQGPAKKGFEINVLSGLFGRENVRRVRFAAIFVKTVFPIWIYNFFHTVFMHGMVKVQTNLETIIDLIYKTTTVNVKVLPIFFP